MVLDFESRLRNLCGPILITGHTGFKGTWLTLLLERLGIETIGYSLSVKPSTLYDASQRVNAIPEMFADIRDYKNLSDFVNKHRPTAILHLAAQPLVIDGYLEPLETFNVNALGTANLLDIAYKTDFVKVVGVVTTDKVYKNDNLNYPFKEVDALQGKDPYSASKVAAESAITAWQNLPVNEGDLRIVSLRSGNVIGGGDISPNRIMTDLINSIRNNRELVLRNPKSTRPWQHVLDPLLGYLKAIEHTSNQRGIDSFNFGPTEKSISVSKVVEIASSIVGIKQSNNSTEELNGFAESNYLDLDSNLSRRVLNWKPFWSQEDSIKKTMLWWESVNSGAKSPLDASKSDISEFIEGQYL